MKMTELLTRPEQLNSPEVMHRNEVEAFSFHKEHVGLNTFGESIYDPADIGLSGDVHAVLGELKLGGGDDEENNSFVIVKEKLDDRDGTGGGLLLIGLGKRADLDSGLGVNGKAVPLKINHRYEVGRKGISVSINAPIWDGVDANISRDKHLGFMVVDGGVLFMDDSLNGSEIKGDIDSPRYKKSTESNGHMTEHTNFAFNRAEAMGLIAQDQEGRKFFKGHEVIGRDIKIDSTRSMVDLRSWTPGGEAIVIDSTNPNIRVSGEYQKLHNAYLKRSKNILGRNKQLSEQQVLENIYETVVDAMEYDLPFVDAHSDALEVLPKEDRVTDLAFYLSENKGVCRHMAIAAAWLGAKLADEGALSGAMTTGANQRRADNAAHEWARYTAQDGTVYIIDPAQKRFGKLEDFVDKEGTWEYFRDKSERNKYEAINNQKTVSAGDIAISSRAKHLRKLLGK